MSEPSAAPVSTPPAAPRPRLSRRRYWLFALIAASLSIVVGVVVLLGADLYLHRRAEKSAGLNLWGYRGAAVGRKAADEVRIAFLGGSTMFGYGVTWQDAIPAVVERHLNAALPPVRSVNLAINNEGAYSFLYTLQDYDYLDADIVVLYEGYNDLKGDEAGGNLGLLRHESAVFRLTGYYPILPLVLSERAMLFRYGDLETAYQAKRGQMPKTVFRPGLAQRSVATALETANSVGESLGKQIGKLSTEVPRQVDGRTEAGCASPWAMFCQSVYRAIQHALARGQSVAVGSQPLAIDGALPDHLSQQTALKDMLARHFSGNPRVIHADLLNAVNLHDANLTFDDMHLTVPGNAVVAEQLSAMLQPLVAAVRRDRPRP